MWYAWLKLLKRARGSARLGGIFSISMAMAWALKLPIIIGKGLRPLTSPKTRAYAPDCVWLYDNPTISSFIFFMSLPISTYPRFKPRLYILLLPKSTSVLLQKHHQQCRNQPP